jgi:hypothetical protein
MSGPIFRETYTPPTRWVRFKNGLAGFITHPAVIAGEVAFIVGVIAAVVVAIIANGWLS